MPNSFGLAGAQPQKQTKFAPIYTPRWSSGIWTNRSPLRDATTTRISEKYYGAAGDALIAGANVEITNRLTLARRPGNSVFDSNSYTSVDRFEEFRLFSPTTEQINIMIDQANALYSLYNGAKSEVFAKSAGAGQTFMQSVGNSLYFADGVDNKKWLQSLFVWTANTALGTSTSPFMSTFFVDQNGNIQQLLGTAVPVTTVAVVGNELTVTSSSTLTSLIQVGDDVTFPPSGMAASFLEGTTVTVTAVTTNTLTADLINSNYGPASESGVTAVVYGAGTPTSGSTQPTWNTQVPSVGNDFAGGATLDGSVFWANLGPPVKNWGIVGGSTPVVPAVGSSFSNTWKKFTFYSIAGVVIDSNGNLQQVVTAGQSGTVTPTWHTTVGQTTTDGTVVWKMIQTKASLTWHPNTVYTPAQQLTSVADSSGGSAVYSGNIVGGAANALAGQTFLVSGFENDGNNGSFTCTASTIASLTLSNASAVAETTNAQASQEGTLQYVVASASGQNCLFQVSPLSNPTLTGNVSAYLYNNVTSGAVGCFNLKNPTSTGSAIASDTTLNSLYFTGTPLGSGASLVWNTVNGAGEVVGSTNPFPSHTQNYQLIILGNLNVPVAGQYAFTIKHHDGMIWGIGGGAVRISGTSNNPIGQTITANQGFTVFGGTNIGLSGGQVSTDTFVVNFPTAGVYPFEVDYAYWYHSGQILDVLCQGSQLPNGTPQSGTTEPIWPAWTLTNAPGYPSVAEVGGSLAWSNIGPATDFVWAASTNFTLPNTSIIDSNGNIESPYRTGVTGSTEPTWQPNTYQLTTDNPNLVWINEGPATAVPGGSISAFNGGYIYGVSLVNTLDNTVSNCSPVSVATGNFVGANGITIPAGAGLPPVSQIDPQSNWVAIFRSTDGQAQPFLIPGPNEILGTLPLWQYLVSGYTDKTPDASLDNLIEGPIEQQNTPPVAGAKNLAYYVNRIFYSVGNVVYWTSGPTTPAGNGINGTSPLNFDSFPSLVKRIVPTTSGALIFTVSDVYVIQQQGGVIQPGVILLQGTGLLSYNALDVNGAIIGFFSTDNQFLILDPNAGETKAGFPLEDQFSLTIADSPGQDWDPSQVYVAWHTSGQDTGWFVADGSQGWYRMLPTPAPETGYTWCPFATIAGGVKAVQSIEVTPGVHKLLLGPVGTGNILKRDVAYFTDNTTPYNAWAVVGSCVLAQPGQLALVSFVTTQSVNIGTPLTIGLLLDEALPYYVGGFDVLKDWDNDPPNLKASSSIKSQRFYLSELNEAAPCLHTQVKVQWGYDTVQNELLSMTIYGGFLQEI